ncbi:NAD(P)H-dependent glycerol-3-phosphate dehydrogenase [Parvularcula sp. LCG005]|uniref:NAD(P)H-dependent glycerol-3-phosphate dehydrogenase n=1 Tax=Parvularcula sp. LCG005 TaxID=3078805 RepID=UPI0029438589|nr:NAD(P)H-dependent glycerol-3-phosphate dehydrogenase [Parvularcula sp. LCG005]WOI53508.1 NAD(P)H-dependent glycerol-3-phosphate dehydrogenase [Parvularcula sp. LCG005]
MSTSTQPFHHCVVVGAGAFGTALAILLDRSGRKVTLWTRNEKVVEEIRQTGENKTYLAGHRLPPSISATTDRGVLADGDAVLGVVPTQHLRAEMERLREAAGQRPLPIALCCKGIEQRSGLLPHRVMAEVWPEAQVSILSGPSFAADVAAGLPTAVTLADEDEARGYRWLETLGTPAFRPYLTDDLSGVAIGAAVKNVLAIACGIVDGRGYGESARAALMTRGFAECLRFADSQGARSSTLHGMSGLGDIILTCSSRQSRNMSLGYEIGRGQSAAAIVANRQTVAEGAATAPILVALAEKAGVDMPIASAVAALVSGKADIDETINALLNRPLKMEHH